MTNMKSFLLLAILSEGILRKLRGIGAKILFCLLYWHDKSDADLLFSSNDHDDGLNVDIPPYDVTTVEA